LNDLNFRAVVSKIVKTKSEKGIIYKVLLSNGDGHRITLDFGEQEPEGYAPQQGVMVRISNPQTVLGIGKEESE
jgi:hypothetical protein